MNNFVIGTIQENIKTLSNEIQVLNSNTPSKLTDLSDVSAATPADGDTLVYNANYNIFEPKANSSGNGGSSIEKLDDIPDVTITTAQDNQVLKYSSGKWINSDVVGGGGATYTGGTAITVSNNVISNDAPDQIVILNNGTGISVTGNYPNFTITNTVTDTTYTQGIGVTITANEINIGQSVGTTDDVQFAAVICDEISTDVISERTTGGGITLTSAVNMTGIPEITNPNKLLYNTLTGEITHQADTGSGVPAPAPVIPAGDVTNYHLVSSNTAGTETEWINIYDLLYPVGSVKIMYAVWGGFPGQTWVEFGQGRTLVGLNSGDTDFDTIGETGGAKTHTLSINEMPTHTHTQNAHRHLQLQSTTRPGGNQITGSYADGTGAVPNGHTDYQTPIINDSGGGQPHNNLQPYIVVRYYRRTV